jgi:hypothetical protein
VSREERDKRREGASEDAKGQRHMKDHEIAAGREREKNSGPVKQKPDVFGLEGAQRADD